MRGFSEIYTECEKRLKKEVKSRGRNLGNGILKVDFFVNHQIYPDIMEMVGESIASFFKDKGITKVITVETSGIIPAYVTSKYLNVPLVFARKKKPITMEESICDSAPSHTKGGIVELHISKEFLNQDDKIYQATVKIGETTDTLDDDGTLLNKVAVKKVPLEIEETVRSFVGEYTFEIPMYSAVKVQGKKLYEYAREGKKPDIDLSKTVTVYVCFTTKEPYLDNDVLYVDYQVHASKGLYVRSLSLDIGKKLGYPAYNYRLRRIKAGKFHIEDAYTLLEVEAKKHQFISLANALPFPQIQVNDAQYQDLCHGKKTTIEATDDYVSLVNETGHLLAIYKKERNTSYKAVNVFLEGETR